MDVIRKKCLSKRGEEMRLDAGVIIRETERGVVIYNGELARLVQRVWR